MRIRTIAAAATLTLLGATAADAHGYNCALCQPLGSDCSDETFATQSIIAEVSDPHFERNVAERCLNSDLELGCGREFDRMLYTFGSIKIVRGDVSATPVELQAEYDYASDNERDWGGVYLEPGKRYLVTISDTRIFNRRYTIRRACELYPEKDAPVADPGALKPAPDTPPEKDPKGS